LFLGPQVRRSIVTPRSTVKPDKLSSRGSALDLLND
jgi:hypothetical protein